MEEEWDDQTVWDGESDKLPSRVRVCSINMYRVQTGGARLSTPHHFDKKKPVKIIGLCGSLVAVAKSERGHDISIRMQDRRGPYESGLYDCWVGYNTIILKQLISACYRTK